MVARIVCGTSIRRILSYNEHKIKNAGAELLMAGNFPTHPAALSFKGKMERFDMLTRQNERTKTNALHITLNFSVYDQIDSERLKLIALEYMDKIGFGDQPFLVYQHFDAAHPHIHIATVNIADGGQRIETHNIGKIQSEKARKEIEQLYGLIRAEDQKKEEIYMFRPIELEKVQYGKQATKAAISSIVREVIGTYKFTSLPELNAILRQFNILADRGEEGSKMFQKGGLVYRLVNEKGEKVGVPIKASSIFTSPTLKNLEKKYPVNEAARKPYSQRLKHLLDKALATGNREQMEEQLRRNGIRILMRQNVQGQVYGITFIDNGTRTVFNGSDLGKKYSAKAFMQRMAGEKKDYVVKPSTKQKGAVLPPEDKTPAKESAKENYPAQQQPVILMLMDAVRSEKYEESLPDPLRKKKKKLQIE